MPSKQRDKHISPFLIFLIFHIYSFTAFPSSFSTIWLPFHSTFISCKATRSICWLRKHLHACTSPTALKCIDSSCTSLPRKASVLNFCLLWSPFVSLKIYLQLSCTVFYCCWWLCIVEFFFPCNSMNWLAIFHYFCGAMETKSNSFTGEFWHLLA